MSTAPLFTDDLLDPIPTGRPVGADLRWTADWDRIKEARRADDDLRLGKWAKKEQKSADWRAVHEMATAWLRDRSKDLQLSLWLTEANIKLYGFPGLRDGLKLTRELMSRYWDCGLYPAIEDGPEDRSGPFEWLNSKLVNSVTAIAITAREDGGQDYSFIDLIEARRVGSEASCHTSDGDVDDAKKKAFDTAVAQGRISLDMFDAAVKKTPRARYEDLAADFQQSYDEFKALERVVDEKFGDVAPNLAAFRAAMNDIRQEVLLILEKKQQQEPAARAAAAGAATAATPATGPMDRPAPARPAIPASEVPVIPDAGGNSWHEAEQLVRSGEVEKGLAAMTRLAAAETCGRNRFQRKLLLADVCLKTGRERLARSILEQLAEQIEKLHLEEWESSGLIGSVWARLIRLYRKNTDNSSDADRAASLYEQLCRLDPWQALNCE
jgi:type VI secretion system protein ImpA